MRTKLIWVTPDAEEKILYIARVSSPNQGSANIGLIKYLIAYHHWSPFEMANMCVEIETSRAISAQILRHRSFSFQEFSQRYADVTLLAEFEVYPARRQDNKNRQNSIDDLNTEDVQWFYQKQIKTQEEAVKNYKEALERGIAKESARFLLPMETSTKLYMNGTLRSWITYFGQRLHKHAQLEHRLLAEQMKDIFVTEFPIISSALNNFKDFYENGL